MRRARPVLLLLAVSAAAGAEEPRVRHVSAVRPSEAAAWEARVIDGLRAGTLALRRADADPFLPGRTHARYAQLLDGIPVEGGELVVQTDGTGAVSVFGSLLEGLAAPPAPRLSADHALDVVARATGTDLGPGVSPRLLVLPLPGGGRATWAVRAFTGDDLVLHFVD
ncbi:MAG TPA: hypothetical protein VFM29_06400, partial [Vicinamibacteria bacterium]|nr:hypothetical protein [Vicinamibacteria bacterium]